MKPMNPREIVSELDKFIVGQAKAKKAVAIALRNRWRRQQVPEDLRDEIAPKNIIMIGPTGVGKTEIARRLAKLAQLPFLKIEASKFTEVGYVGRDVESMVRDLMELAVKQVKDEETENVQAKSREIAEERVLDLLLPPVPRKPAVPARPVTREEPGVPPAPADELKPEESASTREKLRKMLKAGKLDEREVELEITQQNTPVVEIFSASGMEEMDINLKDMFGNMFPKKTKKRKVKLPEAMETPFRGASGMARWRPPSVGTYSPVSPSVPHPAPTLPAAICCWLPGSQIPTQRDLPARRHAGTHQRPYLWIPQG